MSNKILILGYSGSGKSRAIKGLNAEETRVIQTTAKAMPFRGGKVYCAENKSLKVTDDYHTIYEFLKVWSKDETVKNVVIDDSQYLIINEFMKSSTDDLRGNQAFQRYNLMAQNFWNLLTFIDNLREDLTVFFLHHLEETEAGKTKPKTIGKLLDDKVCIEGMFTYVLTTGKDDSKYCFHTNDFGLSKTPEEMFENTIENDLQLVLDGIKNY